MIEQIVRRGKGVTEVPKVTCRRGIRRFSELSPFSSRADEAVGYKAKPEIEDDPEVQVKRVVTGNRRERRNEGEVGQVAQYDRQQSLEKIDEH
jgi:hypothetical protein